MHPEDRQRVMDKVRDVLENKHPGTREFRIVRPDGQERHILGETEIALDGQGNIAHFMGVERDLTEQNVPICVADEGKGFDLSTLELGNNADGGMGMYGIRSRLTASGGNLIIDSIEGRGRG
jgi:hypothetical protein